MFDSFDIADPLFEDLDDWTPDNVIITTTIRTGTSSPQPLPPPTPPQPIPTGVRTCVKPHRVKAPLPPAASPPPAAPVDKPQCLILPSAAARQIRRIATKLQPVEREAITTLLANYTATNYRRALEITAAYPRASRPRFYLRRILAAHNPSKQQEAACVY
jgi:hypothetical protein